MWIGVGVAAVIAVFLVSWLVVRGADMKRRNMDYSMDVDEEQERILQ